jgi:hypothetical protein
MDPRAHGGAAKAEDGARLPAPAADEESHRDAAVMTVEG